MNPDYFQLSTVLHIKAPFFFISLSFVFLRISDYKIKIKMPTDLSPHYSDDFFANAQSAMDDWHYEMRREIQEIVVSGFI